MKAIQKIVLTLTMIVLGGTLSFAQNYNNTSIQGNGIMTTRTAQTKGYDKIEVSGPISVTLVKGTEGTIEITAESNVQERVVTESDGTTLIISLKNNTSLLNTQKIKVKVPFKDLSAISLRGSGDVEGKDRVKASTLTLNLSGSGDIDLDIDADRLAAELSGSGEIELSGKVTNADIKSTGSGKFDCEKLVSDNAEITLSGSGDVKMVINKSLTGTIRGSGTIMYGGNPPTNKVDVRGSGKVKPF